MSRAVLGICCFRFCESMVSYSSNLHWFAHHLLTAGLPEHPVWRQMSCPPPMPLHSFSQGVSDSSARHSFCMFLRVLAIFCHHNYLIIFDLAQQFLCPWLSFWNQFMPLQFSSRTHFSSLFSFPLTTWQGECSRKHCNFCTSLSPCPPFLLAMERYFCIYLWYYQRQVCCLRFSFPTV